MKNKHVVSGNTPVSVSDIESVKMDFAEDTIHVKVSVPGLNGRRATYRESLTFSADFPSPELKNAAAAFSEALANHLNSGGVTQQEMPCDTCSGKCCARHFETVAVTQFDADRMLSGGLNRLHYVQFFEDGPSFNGSVGFMKTQPWGGYSKDENEKACVALGKDGRCTIYEHRPQVCRDYSAWDCDIKEEDPSKVKLKVVR